MLHTQEELEAHAMSAGKARFMKRAQRAESRGEASTAGAGASLLRQVIQPLSNALMFFIEEQRKARGPKHALSKVLDVLARDPKLPSNLRKKGKPITEDEYRDACDTVAFMAARIILDAVLRRVVVPIAAKDVSDLLVTELKCRRFSEMAPALWDFKVKQTADATTYKHRRESMLHAIRTAKLTDAETGTEFGVDVSDITLSDQQELAVGVKIVDLFIQSTDLVFEQTRMSKARKAAQSPRTHKMLAANPETLDWLAERAEAMGLLWPVALPMVEPPLPWGQGVRGGYMHALRGRFPFVRGGSKAGQRVVNAAVMPHVYEAVNRVQATAWKVNRDVHGLLTQIVERGGGMAGIPELWPVEEPTKPATDDHFETLRRERRAAIRRGETVEPAEGRFAEYLKTWADWKKKAEKFHKTNRARGGARRAMVSLLSVANLYAERDALWFVWSVDFRGRLYPVATGMNPQGNDVEKGLLTFAHGRPLGRDGARYLAIHGANCLGETPDGLKVSKMTLDARVKWIEDHSSDIGNVYADPMLSTWWQNADDPFQFYAFCCEWTRMREWLHQHHENTRENFVSALPCSADGSCNGLQHYSALLQDPSGGTAVNLLPTTPDRPNPSDIYLQVVGATLTRIEQDAAKGGDEWGTRTVTRMTQRGAKVKKTVRAPGEPLLARLWLTSGLVTRKALKRLVMTYPYGSRVYGMQSQLDEHLSTRGNGVQESKKLYAETRRHFSSPEALAKAEQTGETKHYGDLLKPACAYLAKVAMREIEGIVVAAADAMAWFQRAAREIAKAGKCVEWTVPGTGFPVRQRYMEFKETRVKTMLCGQAYKPVVNVETTTPLMTKQANAVSPNIIHSLDAAALMQTVRLAAMDGVESFAMVHDSYGAPAGDCAVLAYATRAAFVSLYTDRDVMADLAGQLLAQMPDDARENMPAPPEPGTLDLGGVYASDFFFA